MFRSFDLRALRAGAMALVVAFSLSGCLSVKSYVDPKLPVVTKADLVPTTTPHPLQLQFQFLTNGKPNPRATNALRPQVLTVANQSGMFSTVGDAPVGTDGGTLTVTIDNVADVGNAVGKGIGTGLTFGLAGSLVTDGYVCTVTYTRDGKTLSTKVEHAIHSTVGNKKGPEGLVPMKVAQASEQVMQQMMWNALNDLSRQQAFQ
ncbi:MAG: hypothetical protein HOQ01_01485 [Lysobacter sp.]|nr:hypothetical protein [Lysobacter sp.]